MPTTYVLRNTTTNGLAPPGANEFTANSTTTWDVLTTTAAAATLAISTPVSTTETGYAHTASGVPGSAGAAGIWTVEVNITVAFTPANGTHTVAIRIHRVNSTGVVQASSVQTAGQATSTTGIKTFSVDASGIGAFGATDRVRVDYIFQNTSTMTAGGPTIQANTTSNEITMPDPQVADSARYYTSAPVVVY